MTLNLKMFPISVQQGLMMMIQDSSLSLQIDPSYPGGGGGGVTRLQLAPLGCKLRDVGQYLKDRQHTTGQPTSSIILLNITKDYLQVRRGFYIARLFCCSYVSLSFFTLFEKTSIILLLSTKENCLVFLSTIYFVFVISPKCVGEYSAIEIFRSPPANQKCEIYTSPVSIRSYLIRLHSFYSSTNYYNYSSGKFKSVQTFPCPHAAPFLHCLCSALRLWLRLDRKVT